MRRRIGSIPHCGRWWLATRLAIVAILAPACARSLGTADEGRLRVVASFYPLAEAAQRLGADAVVVTNLTPPGVEPHDLELTADDLEAIAAADVVVYLGGGFQPAVEDALASTDATTVDALAAVSTLAPPAGTEIEAELTADPHVWLDPVRFSTIVERISTALEDAEPSIAATLRANRDRYLADIAALDEAYSSAFSTCERRTIVTSHAAFGYLADRYQLTLVAISGLSPDAEPDPARLAELSDLVEREGVTTIFAETLASPEVARTLAEEAGVTVETLDPIEGLTDEEVGVGEDYVSVMRRNLETLRRALDCG